MEGSSHLGFYLRKSTASQMTIFAKVRESSSIFLFLSKKPIGNLQTPKKIQNLIDRLETCEISAKSAKIRQIRE